MQNSSAPVSLLLPPDFVRRGSREKLKSSMPMYQAMPAAASSEKAMLRAPIISGDPANGEAISFGI